MATQSSGTSGQAAVRPKKMYVYNIPYQIRKRLMDILDMNDNWKDLAALMGYDAIQIDKFRRDGLCNRSATDSLLTNWGQRNFTADQLFLLLLKLSHFQAMEVLKPCVDPKYHKYISYNSAPPGHTSLGNTTTARLPSGIPMPPRTYSHQSASEARDLWMNVSNENRILQPQTPQVSGPYFHSSTNQAGSASWDLPSCFRNERPQDQQVLRTVDLNASSNGTIAAASYTGHQEHSGSHANRQPVVNHLQNLPMILTQGDGAGGQAINVPAVPSVNNPNIGLSPVIAQRQLLGARTGDQSRRRNVSSGLLSSDQPELIMLRKVPFHELKQACNDFSPDNCLGRGGFGEVYRGKWNGQDVAVKRIREDRRGAAMDEYQKCIKQTATEIEALHTFPAENILALLAFSLGETLGSEPCLVYQFMPNGSVADRLRNEDNTLSWERRGNIALGTARGLLYLHSNNIVHGDIKSANILLDKHFEPKIGDFGLARGGPDMENISYKLVTQIQGTQSYLPEDYIRSHHLTVDVDTFCYGIFLFELVTGKPPSWKPYPGQRIGLRDILLKADNPHPWIDTNPEPDQSWPTWLYFLGHDCAKESRRFRPKMGLVLTALEELHSNQAALALKNYHEMRVTQLDNIGPGHSARVLRSPPEVLARQQQQQQMRQQHQLQQQQPQHQQQRLGMGELCQIINDLENVPPEGGPSTVPRQGVQVVLRQDGQQVASNINAQLGWQVDLPAILFPQGTDDGIPAVIQNEDDQTSESQSYIIVTEDSVTSPVTSSSNVTQSGTNMSAPPRSSFLASRMQAINQSPGNQLDRDSLPVLPDFSNLDEDDSLADQRLLSVEASAQQAASLGLFQ